MPKIVVIVPCHNESKRLHCSAILDFLSLHPEFQLLFVNDGSTDDTKEILSGMQKKMPESVMILEMPVQKGKGEAVRLGLLESLKKKDVGFHGFMDADLAVSLQEMHRLYFILCTSDYKFIFGSRIKKIGSIIIRNEWRHFFSRIIATIIGFITKLDVYDTQCSAKIFHSELIKTFAEKKFHTRWLFDIEIIYRINRTYGNLSALGKEEPLLEWSEIGGSKLKWYNMIKIVKEIAVVYKYYRSK